VSILALIIGSVLALAVGVMATLVGLDRDRALYPVVMIVIAALYSLYAVIGESMHALVVECVVGAGFIAVALVGFRRSLWLVAAALAAHGLFDAVHGALIPNPGVPPWWPEFCAAYDIVAAAYLAWLIRSGRIRAAV
jgi:hypothetical protein